MSILKKIKEVYWEIKEKKTSTYASSFDFNYNMYKLVSNLKDVKGNEISHLMKDENGNEIDLTIKDIRSIKSNEHHHFETNVYVYKLIINGKVLSIESRYDTGFSGIIINMPKGAFQGSAEIKMKELHESNVELYDSLIEISKRVKEITKEKNKIKLQTPKNIKR